MNVQAVYPGKTRLAGQSIITRAECKPGVDHGIITVEVGKNYMVRLSEL